MENPLLQKFIDENLVAPTDIEMTHGTASIFTARKPGKSINEDAACIASLSGQYTLIAIADGIGGHPGGELAARIAIESIYEFCHDLISTGNRPLVLDIFDLANQRILEKAAGSGTTLVIAEIQGKTLRTYHAGDSAAWLVGGKGKLKFKTMNHSPLGLVTEAALTHEPKMTIDEIQYIVTNFVGSEEMRVEVGPQIHLGPRDILLVASDGLFDNCSEPEIIENLVKGPFNEASGRLSGLAYGRIQKARDSARFKSDDLSLAVFRLHD